MDLLFRGFKTQSISPLSTFDLRPTSFKTVHSYKNVWEPFRLVCVDKMVAKMNETPFKTNEKKKQ